MRVGLHLSGAEQLEVRVGHLLRGARRDLRREHRPAPLGQPVDAHARLRSGRAEVPLPVVAAAGDRLVRQLGLLRLPGALPHARPRPDLGRDQSRSLHRRSQADPASPAASSATTSGSSTARRSRRSPRRAPQQGVVWVGTNDGKVWISRDAGKQVDRPVEEREHAAVGTGAPHRLVALRSGHGLHGGRLSPRRQPRSLPVQDHRLRPDLDAHRRRRCRRGIRSTTRCRSPRTRTARA